MIDPVSQRESSDSTSGWQDAISRLGLAGTGFFAFYSASTSIDRNFNNHDSLVVLALALYVVGFLLLIAASMGRWTLSQASGAALAGTLAAVALLGYATILVLPNLLLPTKYLNDVQAYSHEAAERLLDGENPYEVTGSENIDEVNRKFGLSLIGVTRLADGSPIERLMNYPAGHFLVFVPTIAIGLDDLRWTTLAASMCVIALLWQGAPRQFRPLVALPVIATSSYVVSIPSHGFDSIWVVPLLGTVIFLNRNRLLAALLYGIAISIKQQAWYVAPFLLIWVWKTTQGTRNERLKATASFAGRSAGVFLVVNLPFILWSPIDWLKSVFYIATADQRFEGTGLSALTVAGILDLDRGVFFLLTVAMAAVLIAVYWRFFDRMRPAIWIFPAILLWFGYRSLSGYFTVWAPILVLGLLLEWRAQNPVAVSRDPGDHDSAPISA